MSSAPRSNRDRQRVGTDTERSRENGRTLECADVGDPRILTEAARQSRAVAASAHADRDQAFIDSLSLFVED